MLLQIWNCTQDRSNEIVHDFFKSSHFNDGIPVIPGKSPASNDMQSFKVKHCKQWLMSFADPRQDIVALVSHAPTSIAFS
jgi:hypothetical protein